jgi:hypothetical protein
MTSTPGTSLYVTLTQRFRGEPASVAAAMLKVSELLQREVDARAERFAADTVIFSKPVNAVSYTGALAEQSEQLAYMFSQAEISFAEASSPSGTPDMLRDAYAAFLDRVLFTKAALDAVQAPPTFLKTQAAYRTFLDAFYRETIEWPALIRGRAASVSGDGCDIELSASYDMATLERALAEETEAAATISES